ncbi:MAG TPA: DUF1501 domain-containing protein, partial [Planctomycetaceae bacterium]|nr:DUF1501 domain-containing protein [Planctomycetaceae bacterium]
MRRVGWGEGRATMVSRRDFLRVGGLSMVGLSVADKSALATSGERAWSKSCIFILMTGGPSQLETFDPKPNAPPRIRGPLQAIPTAIPGVWFSEAFPGLAQRADKLAVLRSLCHDAAPIHETGYQYLHTARLCRNGRRFPCFGSVVAATLGPRNGAPPFVVLPDRLGNTGVDVYRGDGAGFLGEQFEPVVGLDGATHGSGERTASRAQPSAAGLRFEEAPGSVRRRYGE